MEAYTTREHAGVIIEIVHDDEPGYGPQDNDNAGTIYSWADDYDGDERISEPDYLDCDKCGGEGTVPGSDEPTAARYDRRTCPQCDGNGWIRADLASYMAHYYDAALTVPLRYSDYGSSGARIHVTDADNANAAICFTQKEIDYEWSGHVDPYPVKRKNPDGSPGEIVEYGGARKYAEARINELDEWLQGLVWGIVIREDTRAESTEDIENSAGKVLESVWGFIGEPDAEYIRSEANAMAESCAAELKHEAELAHEWACRDVVTV